MKINKLSYISLLVAGMMTVSSCSDILDTPPTTSPSEAIFWQSKSDFNSARVVTKLCRQKLYLMG